MATFQLSPHVVFPVYTSPWFLPACSNFLSLQGHQSDLGPNSFTKATSLKSPLQLQSYSEVLGDRLVTDEFGEEHNSSHNRFSNWEMDVCLLTKLYWGTLKMHS